MATYAHPAKGTSQSILTSLAGFLHHRESQPETKSQTNKVGESLREHLVPRPRIRRTRAKSNPQTFCPIRCCSSFLFETPLKNSEISHKRSNSQLLWKVERSGPTEPILPHGTDGQDRIASAPFSKDADLSLPDPPSTLHPSILPAWPLTASESTASGLVNRKLGKNMTQGLGVAFEAPRVSLWPCQG